jgi:hypothetical protein
MTWTLLVIVLAVGYNIYRFSILLFMWVHRHDSSLISGTIDRTFAFEHAKQSTVIVLIFDALMLIAFLTNYLLENL